MRFILFTKCIVHAENTIVLLKLMKYLFAYFLAFLLIGLNSNEI